MPDLATFGVFMGAALALILVPGPAVLYIVARGNRASRSHASVLVGLGTATALAGRKPFYELVLSGRWRARRDEVASPYESER